MKDKLIDSAGNLICQHCNEDAGINVKEVRNTSEDITCKKCGKRLIN